jgi:hypothetical protein
VVWVYWAEAVDGKVKIKAIRVRVKGRSWETRVFLIGMLLLTVFERWGGVGYPPWGRLTVGKHITDDAEEPNGAGTGRHHWL